ncbi:PLD nuclease N-terminal domain-containing protein [Oerskovia sp. M15]
MSRVLLTLLAVGLAVYALADCATSDENDRSGIPKGLWIVMIIFLPFVGPLAWILVSRTQRSRRTSMGGPGGSRRPLPGSRRRSTGPVAPDDDPDFLWKLEQQRRRDARGDHDGPDTVPGTGEAAPILGSGLPGEPDGAPDAPPSGNNEPS